MSLMTWEIAKPGRLDRYAKYATENLAFAASRIERGQELSSNVLQLSPFGTLRKAKRPAPKR